MRLPNHNVMKVQKLSLTLANFGPGTPAGGMAACCSAAGSGVSRAGDNVWLRIQCKGRLGDYTKLLQKVITESSQHIICSINKIKCSNCSERIQN